jgi:hypothetical protein
MSLSTYSGVPAVLHEAWKPLSDGQLVPFGSIGPELGVRRKFLDDRGPAARVRCCPQILEAAKPSILPAHGVSECVSCKANALRSCLAFGCHTRGWLFGAMHGKASAYPGRLGQQDRDRVRQPLGLAGQAQTTMASAKCGRKELKK